MIDQIQICIKTAVSYDLRIETKTLIRIKWEIGSVIAGVRDDAGLDWIGVDNKLISSRNRIGQKEEMRLEAVDEDETDKVEDEQKPYAPLGDAKF